MVAYMPPLERLRAAPIAPKAVTMMTAVPRRFCPTISSATPITIRTTNTTRPTWARIPRRVYARRRRPHLARRSARLGVLRGDARRQRRTSRTSGNPCLHPPDPSSTCSARRHRHPRFRTSWLCARKSRPRRANLFTAAFTNLRQSRLRRRLQATLLLCAPRGSATAHSARVPDYRSCRGAVTSRP